MPEKKPKKEAEIQREILDYINTIKESTKKPFTFWRENNTPSPNIVNGEFKGMRRLPKYALPGVSDIIVLAVFNGVPSALFLEVKRPKTYQSPGQKEFQAEVENVGLKYRVVRSIEDVEAVFEELGLDK